MAQTVAAPGTHSEQRDGALLTKGEGVLADAERIAGREQGEAQDSAAELHTEAGQATVQLRAEAGHAAAQLREVAGHAALQLRAEADHANARAQAEGETRLVEQGLAADEAIQQLLTTAATVADEIRARMHEDAPAEAARQTDTRAAAAGAE